MDRDGTTEPPFRTSPMLSAIVAVESACRAVANADDATKFGALRSSCRAALDRLDEVRRTGRR